MVVIRYAMESIIQYLVKSTCQMKSSICLDFEKHSSNQFILEPFAFYDLEELLRSLTVAVPNRLFDQQPMKPNGDLVVINLFKESSVIGIKS